VGAIVAAILHTGLTRLAQEGGSSDTGHGYPNARRVREERSFDLRPPDGPFRSPPVKTRRR
jgi:hypothetical protein